MEAANAGADGAQAWASLFSHLCLPFHHSCPIRSSPGSLNPASALRDPLPHFLRCVELARQQRNDFLLARCDGGDVNFAGAGMLGGCM